MQKCLDFFPWNFNLGIIRRVQSGFFGFFWIRVDVSHCLKFIWQVNQMTCGKVRMSRVLWSGVQTIPAPGTGPGSAA